MRRAFSYVALLALLIAGVMLFSRYRYEQNDGFSVANIQFEVPYRAEWETGRPSEEVASILEQKFVYLGKGARAYAFLSEDGQYVLKFFKYRYHVPHWTVRYLPPFQPFEYFRAKKLHKVSLDTVLTGYKIAFDKDPEGTGTLYAHLNTTEALLPSITVIDKSGASQIVDLNGTRFVVQRRVQCLADILKECLDSNQVDKAKEYIFLTFDLYRTHHQRGLYDLGVGFVNNNGFLGDQAVHFDVGKMTANEKILEPETQRAVLNRLVANLDKWLRHHYPEKRNIIIQDVRQYLK